MGLGVPQYMPGRGAAVRAHMGMWTTCAASLSELPHLFSRQEA